MPDLRDFYIPNDLAAANDEWGANCGPGALAAIMGVPVAQVRDRFPHFPAKAVTNLTQMRAAAPSHVRVTPAAPADPAPRGPFPVVERALVQIQWTGRWTRPDANRQFAYIDCLKNSHWVAARLSTSASPGVWVYDVNVNWDGEIPGGWVPVATWATRIALMIIEEKKARTGWYAREILQLR